MNPLLRNQFRKEVREHLFLLSAWWGMLLVELIHGLGSTPNMFGPSGEYVVAASYWGVSDLGLFAFAILIPLAVGLADSPGNSSGFIRTRPVSVRVVWGAKLALLGLCVALPAVVSPFGVSFAHGAGLEHGWVAALDRLSFLVPTMVLLLCWGGLCSGPAQMARMTVVAAAIIAAALFVTLGVNSWLDMDRINTVFEEPGSMTSRIWMILLASAVVAVVALARQTNGPRTRRLVWVPCAIGLCISVVFSIPGLNFLRTDTSLADEVATALAGTTVRVDPYALKAWKSGALDPRINLSAGYRFEGVPRNIVVVPRVRRATLSGRDGFQAVRQTERSHQRGFGYNPPKEVLNAMARSFDRDVFIHQGSSGHYYYALGTTHADWDASRLQDRIDDPLNLELQFDAECLRIRQVARLPFKDGQTVRGDGMALTLFRPSQQRDSRPNLALRFRLPRALLTRDRELRGTPSYQLRHRFLCLLVHPDRPDALVCFSETAHAVRGSLSGLPEIVLVCRYETGPTSSDSDSDSDSSSDAGVRFDRSFFEGAYVHVFRCEFVGEMDATTRLDDLRLDRRMTEMADSTGGRQMDLAAYREALARLGEVRGRPDSRTMRALLNLIERADRVGLDMEADPGVQQLARLGEADLGVVLEAFGMSRYRSRRAMLSVIDQVARESDRARVIAAFRSHPDLAHVLVGKGWERDARGEILEVLRSRRLMPLRAAALLRDRETYPYLLEQFDHHFDVATYELLWELPDLRPELDRRIAERWEEFRRVLDGNSSNANELRLALRIGGADALRLVMTERGDDFHRMIHALRPVLLLPQAYREARAELSALSPDALTFHPKRRVFIRQTDADPEDPS